MKVQIVVGVVGVLLSGCARIFSGMGITGEKMVEPLVHSPAYAHVQPPSENQGEGSLWSGMGVGFYQDRRASKVGDIVRVRIVEDIKGTKSANTNSDRTSKIEAKTDPFLGIGVDGHMESAVDRLQAKVEFKGEFDGGGATTRSGTLEGDVISVITHVYPNGNMAIEGRREIYVNNEKEYIQISGVIRPADIGADNVVLSSNVADARIEYIGEGDIQDTQGPGWLSRIINWVWPF